jgi:hypothetical protein
MKIPSATLSSTACVSSSLSRKAELSSVIDASDRCSSWDWVKRSTNAVTFARSISGRTGVKMKSTAPLAYALAASPFSDPLAVTKMIGVRPPRICVRHSLAVSNPFSVGIRTSIRIIAKVSSSRTLSAARPDAASTTAYPSGASIARSATRLAALSSTTRIVGADACSWHSSATAPAISALRSLRLRQVFQSGAIR